MGGILQSIPIIKTGSRPVESKQQQLRRAEHGLLQIYPPENTTATTVVKQEEVMIQFCPLRSSLTTQAKAPSTRPSSNNQRDAAEFDCDDDYYSIHTLNINTTFITENKSDRSSSQPQLPLVLLHGYMNGAAYFYRNFSGLSRSFSQIYALDLLGWGLSSRPTWPVRSRTGSRTATKKNTPDDDDDDDDPMAASERFFVESLEAWRMEQRIDKMILAGHSMGGYLSVAYAERYPQHVDKLVLLSPVGVPIESTETLQKRQYRRSTSWTFRVWYGLYEYVFERWTPGDILRHLPESMGRHWIQRYVQRRVLLSPTIDDPTQQMEQSLLVEYLYQNATLPGSGENCLKHLLTPSLFAKKRPLVDRIPQLQIPECHFLYGEYDWMDARGGLNVQEQCRCRRSNQTTTPKVTVHQVRNAGHLLMLDNPEEFDNGLAKVASRHPVLVGAVPKEL